MLTVEERVIRLARQKGILRSHDLREFGISREHLRRLSARGVLVRTTRGLYELSRQKQSEHHSLAEVTRRTPGCVICLLSALQFHEIGTEQPPRVWIGIRRGAWRPLAGYPPLEIVTFSDVYMHAGVDVHCIDGVDVRITGIARTVADAFKFRNKIGADVAIEALREVIAKKRCSIVELSDAARLCRVQAVMRPYIEALL